MAAKGSDNNYNVDAEMQENALEKNQQLQYLLFRLFPFWPLIFFAILLGIAIGFTFLRYATPIYEVRARVLINDDSQEKTANLQEIMKIDTRNVTSETEREMEILKSTDMFIKVASQMQLNVRYSQQGNIKSGDAYLNSPFRLQLESPDSVRYVTSGEVKVSKNKVNFNGVDYILDSFVSTPFGKAKWTLTRRFKPEGDPTKWIMTVQPVTLTAKQLKNGLFVAPISKQSSILDVTYIDLFPSRAVQILTTLFAVYASSSVDYKGRIYDNTQKFLDTRLALVSDELTGVEKRLQAYKSAEHIVDLGQEGSVYLSKLRQADAKISELDVQLEVLAEIEKYVARRNNSTDAIPATLGISDPVLLSLLNQLFETEFELERLRQVSGEKNPQIDVNEQMIAKLKPAIISSINNLKLNFQATKRQLEQDNALVNTSINKMPERERILLDINRQQGIKNAIYTFLLQKKEESAIAAASIVPNIRVIERPEPGKMVSPNRQNYYALSIVACLLLAVVYIYLKEFANSRLLFRSQIESRLTIPIIGELVFKPNKTGSPIVVGEGKRTLIAEQFRELRTNLNYAAAASNESKSKVILVTSSVPSEGKSFVAINTSVSLCLTGAKVALMEFDLRKPKISKPLGIQREPGITNFLVGNVKEEDILQKHPTIDNFYIISSGPVPPNPAELIGSNRLVQLMNYLRDNFDYILIDSPPVASVTDAKLLAAHSDITMYIIRHNFTNSIFLKLINDLHQKRSITNLNLVFNGIITKKVLGYGYGKGYGYGYGYAYGYGYGYGYTTEDEKNMPAWKRFFKRLFRRK